MTGMTHAPRTAALLVLGALILTGCDPAPAKDAVGSTVTASETGDAGVPAGYHRKCALGQDISKCPIVRDSPTPTTAPVPKAKPATVAQQQALESAQSYIELSGMSRSGLLRQLTSKAADGFSKADATYAVDHVHADWNAEAVESAQSYMEMGGFSRSSLLRQLTSKAGDGFTKAQAQYAVKKAGL